MFEEIVRELEVPNVDEERDSFLREEVPNCCNSSRGVRVHARQPTDSIQLKSISAIWRCDILCQLSRDAPDQKYEQLLSFSWENDVCSLEKRVTGTCGGKVVLTCYITRCASIPVPRTHDTGISGPTNVQVHGLGVKSKLQFSLARGELHRSDVSCQQHSGVYLHDDLLLLLSHSQGYTRD